MAGQSDPAASSFRPAHNWDEPLYPCLSAPTTCAQQEQIRFCRDLLGMLPRNVFKGAVLGNQDQSLVATTRDYFCSNLHFYTVKHLYVRWLRWLRTISGESMWAVRSLSVLPATLCCGLLSFQILGAGGLTRPGRALLRLQTV